MFGQPNFDVYEAARSVVFDGTAFDCNRRSAGRIYNEWFATVGLAAHPGIRALFQEDPELQYSISPQGVVVTERCSLQPHTLAVEKSSSAESLAQLLGQRTGEEDQEDVEEKQGPEESAVNEEQQQGEPAAGDDGSKGWDGHEDEYI